ncbi:MAG: hypothetical protein COA70_10185 [Planctomycetota bacterium]|nr:MAG: hypothetical protein COA70_10185 [Planctomycetota bacterium]
MWKWLPVLAPLLLFAWYLKGEQAIRVFSEPFASCCRNLETIPFATHGSGLTLSSAPADMEGEQAFVFRNDGKSSVVYHGYGHDRPFLKRQSRGPDRVNPRNPRGVAPPFIELESSVETWTDAGSDWCGTGVAKHVLQPGDSITFTVEMGGVLNGRVGILYDTSSAYGGRLWSPEVPGLW